jgi:NAD(P)-dependent dehydrogenase (short-subunit alcohol dehydrogenase family)
MAKPKKVVLITGAARGLGAGVAAALHQAGWRVALTGLEPELLMALAARLGPDALAAPADVTNAEAVRAAVAAAMAQWGRIDAVVSNAGISNYDLIADMSPRLFRRVMQVNVEGAFNVMQAALPHLIASKGYFLTVASIAAATAPPGMAAYGASKAAAEALTDALRGEVRHKGVDAGVAYFAWLDTDLVRGGSEHPAFAYVREHLPGPLKTVNPASIAVRAIANGVKRRRARVYAPWWIGWAMAWRWRIAGDPSGYAKIMPEVERLCAEESARRGGPEQGLMSEPPAGP